MMEIKIGKKTVELKYTYNSFKYMSDLDFSVLQTIEEKPFQIISVLEELIYGASNNDPKVKFSREQVSNFIESYIEEGNDLMELLETLFELLEKSSFFKSLQKGQSKQLTGM